MVYPELKNNGLGYSGFGVPTVYKQQPLVTTKKAVLTDVHNDDRSLIRNRQERSMFVEGRPVADMVKVGGTKRLQPEGPSSHPFPPPLSSTTEKEHFGYARRKFEFELDKGKLQNNPQRSIGGSHLRGVYNMQKNRPQKGTQMKESNINPLAPKMTYSYTSPFLPSSLGKPGDGVQVSEHDRLKAISEVPKFTNSKRVDVKYWEKRFIHLQNFLKMCDESSNEELLQRLRQCSPAELSKYAVELEKAAIQLTIEEGKEMQRVMALNILQKSPPTMNPLQTSQLPPQTKKGNAVRTIG